MQKMKIKSKISFILKIKKNEEKINAILIFEKTFI